tara:strand:- start:546 stop:800 length:255 start_codon:yes stop_codon:yes gene_type:complete
MAKNFDLTTLESLLQRLEKENNPELNSIVNDLIMTSRKAGASGFTMNEIASLSTMGYIVSQDPQLQSFVAYLISRLQDNDEVFN